MPPHLSPLFLSHFSRPCTCWFPQAAHPVCEEDLVVKVYTRTTLQPLHLAQLLREVGIHSKAVHRWGSGGDWYVFRWRRLSIVDKGLGSREGQGVSTHIVQLITTLLWSPL